MFNIFSKKIELKKNELFDFKQFLIDYGWSKKSDNFYYRGYKTIKFINSSKIMIALNNDKKVKYNHIVTCRVPLDLNEATTLTALTYLK